MENHDESKLSDKANQLSDTDQEILDQVKKLPISEEKKNDSIATMEMYSGPIPHPKILAGYQSLYKNAAEEIIENGLEESRHRRTLETARQTRRGHLAWASMIILAFFSVAFIIGSFVLIVNGHEVIGSIFGGGAFITFAATFLNNITELTSNDDIASSKEEKK